FPVFAQPLPYGLRIPLIVPLLINSFSDVVRLGETTAVNPAKRVTNLKTCKTNTQPHQILRTRPSKHSHMPTGFQHSHALFPHGRRWNKTIPVSAHKPATLGRHRYSIAGNPRFKYVGDL